MESDILNWLKYVGGLLVVIALCTIVWFNSPAREQVKQLEEKVSTLEEQIGGYYRDIAFSLDSTAEQLLAHKFNQPITDEDEDMINELSDEFRDISYKLFFENGNVNMHSEWEARMSDVSWYLRDYLDGNPLTEEEVADLYQALQAIRFIAKDFRDITQYDLQSAYDAIHDEEHEMVERVKYRLSLEY